MIVEPFQVAQVRHGSEHSGMLVWGAVPGDLQAVLVGEGGDAEELGDAAAAGHVDLDAVDALSGQ